MPRGFAKLSTEERTRIASMGGKAVPKEKRKFAVDTRFASECGRKGGMAKKTGVNSFASDRKRASELGRKGAMARNAKLRGEHG